MNPRNAVASREFLIETNAKPLSPSMIRCRSCLDDRLLFHRRAASPFPHSIDLTLMGRRLIFEDFVPSAMD